MDNKQPDITRERLLKSAFCEIHRKGFQAASISNILHETGLTKGALYHHFPTKQALGLAVIDEVIRVQLEGLTLNRLRDSDNPVETLLDIIANFDKQVPAEFVLLGCPLNNLMQEMSPLDQAFQERLNNVLESWFAAVEGALKQGQQHGVIRAEVDYKSAALFIVSAWEGCTGTAKNMQSSNVFKLCMQQLHDYVKSLTVVKREEGK